MYRIFQGYCWGRRTRTAEPEGADLQSAAIAAMRYPNFCTSFLSCQCEPLTVTKERLELSNLAASDPKSDVSANSTTRPLLRPLLDSNQEPIR